jgi:hypothetical protein
MSTYNLEDRLVVGNYDGVLSNGKSNLVLIDDYGEGIDRVYYSDKFPWPLG